MLSPNATLQVSQIKCSVKNTLRRKYRQKSELDNEYDNKSHKHLVYLGLSLDTQILAGSSLFSYLPSVLAVDTLVFAIFLRRNYFHGIS